MLKNNKDIKTLIFISLIVATWVWNWSLPQFQWLPFLLACFGGVIVSSLVHNHVHVNVFKWRFLNVIYDYVLTVIYGYPVFAWIATHNKNHHVWNNREGDFAPSYIVGEENNLRTLLTYPTVSGGVQQKVNFDYLKKIWHTERAKCLYYVSQYAFLFAVYGVAFAVDWKKALLYVIVPQQVALNMVLIFNYIQHIHADEETKYNHSRNILSPVLGFFLFNNGFHTAHHMKPLAHWSELPAEHAKIAANIDPMLNEPSLIWFFIRTYFLAPFIPSLRRPNMRALRIQKESGQNPKVVLQPGSLHN